MRLWAVKNDKGEWLYSDEYNGWVDQLSQATFYDTFADADDDIKYWELSNTYVIELVEIPAKIVVSEEEAEMLENALWPATAIANFSAGKPVNTDMNALEDRLIRAYVNGWTVEKTKRFNVKVPHVDSAYYTKLRNGKLSANSVFGNKDHSQQFTISEIERYGLQDCERIEATDHD